MAIVAFLMVLTIFLKNTRHFDFHTKAQKQEKTARRHSSELTSNLIALQISTALFEVMVLPIIAGFIFETISFTIFPYIILISLSLMTVVV